MDDIPQVADAAGQTIDPGHHQGVSRPEKVEQDLELGAAAALRATGLLSSDHVAAGGLQRAPLQAEILINRRDSGIAIGRHGA
jgi:hypothetical protein